MSQMDPAAPYRYMLEIGGINVCRCKDVQGLTTRSEFTTLREGGNNLYKVAMVGASVYDDLVIKKGFYSVGSEFYSVMRALHSKKNIQRVTLNIIMLSDDFQELGRFSVYNAFPIEYSGPSFDANGKDILFEEIKFHYDFFEYHPGSALGAVIDAAKKVAKSALGI